MYICNKECSHVKALFHISKVRHPACLSFLYKNLYHFILNVKCQSVKDDIKVLFHYCFIVSDSKCNSVCMCVLCVCGGGYMIMTV